MAEILYLLDSSPALFISMTGLLGLTVGSFLNVVIHRLPKMMERDWRLQCDELLEIPAEKKKPAASKPEASATYSLHSPRSACPHCGHKIGALENIPLLSYLFLRGK